MRLGTAPQTSRRDDRGVSPVIGIILMVAITVILAVLVGSFVLDIEKSAKEDSPQASFRVSANPASNNITLEHMGGDKIHHEQTRVIIESGGTTTFNTQDGSGDASVLSVGEVATITLNDASDDTLDFDTDGTIDASTNGTAETFDPGDRVTITLIDTATQRRIFEQSLLVQS